MEFSRTQPASSGCEGLRHGRESKKGPRCAPGRAITLRPKQGCSREVHRDAQNARAERKSLAVGVQETPSKARPAAQPLHQGALQSAGPVCTGHPAPRTQGPSTQGTSVLRTSGCIFCLTYFQKNNICFAEAQHLDIIYSFKNSKMLIQPQRMFPPPRPQAWEASKPPGHRPGAGPTESSGRDSNLSPTACLPAEGSSQGLETSPSR